MPLESLIPHVESLEARFAHDNTLQFLARSRATHQVALWAAHQAGQDPDSAERYARQVVAQSVGSADLQCVIRRICRDLHEVDRPVDETELDQKLRAHQALAFRQA